MRIRLGRVDHDKEIIQLIANFRQSLAELRGKKTTIDVDSARIELAGYRERKFPVYVAETDQNKLVGYLVCRVDEDVVWAESLFGLPEYRREGIGSILYTQAENLAQDLGNETLYNWIDPNNTKIISFLQKRGYTVLNLIELRRPRNGEVTTKKIQVGSNEFHHS